MVADLGRGGIVFEHKVWSSLGEGQLDKYRAWGDAHWPEGCVVVLISASARQHTQPADLSMTWADVHRLLAPLADGDNAPVMLEDFLVLLVEEGLGPPAPVAHEAILSYWPAQSFERNLGAVVSEAAKADWGWVHQRFGWPGGLTTDLSG